MKPTDGNRMYLRCLSIMHLTCSNVLIIYFSPKNIHFPYGFNSLEDSVENKVKKLLIYPVFFFFFALKVKKHASKLIYDKISREYKKIT